MKEQILNELSQMEGKVGFYYHNLVTGETYGYREKEPFLPRRSRLSRRNSNSSESESARLRRSTAHDR